MKKKLFIVLTALVITSNMSIVSARTSVSSDLAEAIRMYKSQNYSQCYVKLDTAIKGDPTNALAYYYKAMAAAQIGKKSEAIENYEKAIALTSERSNINKYAKKGKRCIEEPEKCNESQFEDEVDKFIRSRGGARFSDTVRSDYEKLKIENLMREMNRNDDIAPQKFKEYKDFSSMDNQNAAPSNEEIVAAIRTLQNAGIMNNYSGGMSEISAFMGNNSQDAMLNLMGNSSISPILIQRMLTNNMSLEF